ncbi:uncharacterized protein LOC121393428 [Xenopus laevis]|uniref:Uncharacterized protein LOC121393428 n=1 Tax=Xenopus laevis TaxID=8355 RepID=A0A8J1KKK6_XENLA|nr:uncharacterized protein LOC121393428 [Xenopus laevis]
MQQEPFAGWESLNSMSSRSRRSRSSSRGSPRRRSHHSRKAVEKECSICDNPAMHNKKVCLMCWESMSGKRADDQWSAMRDWFKESMSKSLEDLVGTVTANVIQKVGPSAPVYGVCSEPRHMKKMYPYAEGDVSRWTNPPKVDAAITRVARKTTLPVDEGVSLKDPVERRQDTVLRKAYSVSGLLCKPAVAVTCVAKASKIWLQEIETELQLAGDKDKVGHLVAIDFITDASLEVLKLAARNMGYAVAARRMLWLKHWQADTPSKFNLCALPFEGELLFGPKLDSIISKASAGKSSFLPQERRVRRQPVRAGWADRMPFKDAKTYRPGKQFDRQPFWRNRGQNQLKKEFKQGKPKSF